MTLLHFFSSFGAKHEQTRQICIKRPDSDMMDGSGLQVFFSVPEPPSHYGAPCVYLLSLPSDKLQLTSPAVPFLPEGRRLCLRPYFLLFPSFFPRVKLLCSLLNEGTAALACAATNWHRGGRWWRGGDRLSCHLPKRHHLISMPPK